MNKEENRFDDFLRERLDQHTVEVSPSVWEKINAKFSKSELSLSTVQQILQFQVFPSKPDHQLFLPSP